MCTLSSVHSISFEQRKLQRRGERRRARRGEKDSRWGVKGLDGGEEDSGGEWMFARAEISRVQLAQRCGFEIGGWVEEGGMKSGVAREKGTEGEQTERETEVRPCWGMEEGANFPLLLFDMFLAAGWEMWHREDFTAKSKRVWWRNT